jgi:hypothetical protein
MGESKNIPTSEPEFQVSDLMHGVSRRRLSSILLARAPTSAPHTIADFDFDNKLPGVIRPIGFDDFVAWRLTYFSLSPNL